MYNLLDNYDGQNHTDGWKNIWKLNAPERVRIFVWKVKHNGLLTNKKKHRMNLGSAMCNHCGDVEEDSLHVLRDCPKAVNLWKAVVCTNKLFQFFAGDLQSWIQINMQKNMGRNNKQNWNSFWAYGCYCLWYWHNCEVHDDNYQRPHCIRTHISMNIQEYSDAKTNNQIVTALRKEKQNVKWVTPPIGWVKLNVDGACSKDGDAGCGGTIRGDTGEWLGGFSKSVGICSAHTAELWGVYEGLLLVQQMNFRKIIVETDSQKVYNEIVENLGSSTMGRTLVARIKNMREQGRELVFKHIYSEANTCADELAKHGIHLQDTVCHFNSCPSFLQSLLDKDLIGEPVLRLILV